MYEMRIPEAITGVDKTILKMMLVWNCRLEVFRPRREGGFFLNLKFI